MKVDSPVIYSFPQKTLAKGQMICSTNERNHPTAKGLYTRGSCLFTHLECRAGRREGLGVEK